MQAIEAIEVVPPERWPRPQLGTLWRHRELIYFLIWRDLKIRYKQTFFGVGWAVIQPLIGMVIFSIIFGKLAKLPSGGVPYPVFVLAGLIPWTYFSSAVTSSSQSLVVNTSLVTKVYFPRIVLPVAGTLTWLLDLGVSSVLLAITMAVYGVGPPLRALLLPVLVIFLILTAFSVSVWLSAINVRYRDVAYVTPFLIQVWFFATPVAYSGSLIPPGAARVLYALNPMVGVIEGFKWAALGTPAPGIQVVASSLVVFVLLVTGVIYFLRTEQSFADVI